MLDPGDLITEACTPAYGLCIGVLDELDLDCSAASRLFRS
jgi:hypothetical protein